MDLELLTELVAVSVLTLVGVYFIVRSGIRKIGEAIPGEDAFDRASLKLEGKVDPILEAIRNGVDLLNPKTHGGAGESAPEEKP